MTGPHVIPAGASPKSGLSVMKVLYYGWPDATMPESARVLTPDGFRRIGGLRPGDEIFSAAGRRSKIIAIAIHGPQDVYEIKLKSGRRLNAGAGAPWCPFQSAHGDIKSVMTTEAMWQDYAKLRPNRKTPITCVLTPNAVEFGTELNNAHALGIEFAQAITEEGIPEELTRLYKTSIETRMDFVRGCLTRMDRNPEYVKSRAMTLPENPDPEKIQFLRDVLYGLGMNSDMDLKYESPVLRVMTEQNLSPDWHRTPEIMPRFYLDPIVSVAKQDFMEPMVCLALEPGVYTYVVEGYMTAFTSIYSYDFDRRMPKYPAKDRGLST